MKRIVFSILMLLMGSFGYAQIIKEMDEPFRNANIIKINANLPKDDLYKIVGETFMDNSLVIDFADKDFYTINTAKFGNGFGRRPITIFAQIKENAIFLKSVQTNNESNFSERNAFGKMAKGYEFLLKISKIIEEKVKGRITYAQEVDDN